MKAMILAAGLGTRLHPLTDTKPKALVDVNGVTLLELVIRRLIRFGVGEFIINIHHFPDQIIDFVKQNNGFGQRIEFSDERDQLLDTGGGLLKAAAFLDDGKPFLVYNVDVLCDLDLHELYRDHIRSNALATLAVKERKTSRYFLFDDNMNLSGWINKNTGEEKTGKKDTDLAEYAFSGIHIISPQIFNLITEKGKFSLTNLYLRLCSSHIIRGYVHNSGFWSDVGKVEELERVAKLYKMEF